MFELSVCVHITDVSRVRKGLVLVSKDVSRACNGSDTRHTITSARVDQLLIYNRTSGIYTETWTWRVSVSIQHALARVVQRSRAKASGSAQHSEAKTSEEFRLPSTCTSTRRDEPFVLFDGKTGLQRFLVVGDMSWLVPSCRSWLDFPSLHVN